MTNVQYRLYKAELVNTCLTLLITNTFFAILFLTMLRSFQSSLESICTPNNLVTNTLFKFSQFMHTEYVSSQLLFVNTMKFVFDVFKESLFT